MPTSTSLSERLESIGQSKLAAYINGVQGDGGDILKQQIQSFDLDQLDGYISTYGTGYQPDSPNEEINPAPYFALDDASWDRAMYSTHGEGLIAANKVACFTVAGGQGSRLGYDGPKGCYPTSCVSGKSLFEMFAQTIYANERKYNASIPWYIMTSPLNHEQTIKFFEDHNHFGLDPKNIQFFEQGVMPSFDAQTGDLLLSDPAHLATNPDGHGGAYKALHVSGALDNMLERGIEHLCYFQVDNPNAKIIDPVFIGLHAYSPESSGEFSSKMVAKSSWDEKVGVFCRVGEDISVVEYSDLPEELAKMTNERDQLMFNAGSIAIHIISTAFIQKIATDPEYALPFHRAVKKVSHFDPATGLMVQPDEPNAIKLERFVFDAIALADRSIILETDRIEEFAPVKNATGTDSIVTSKQIQSQRAANWLAASGVDIPTNPDGSVNATIELSPLTALSPEDLKSAQLPESIEPGASIQL
ncbi:MAG: UDPGP type 1 family protein [Phycisphaerales bacterium]|nr:UDPGP type 1 family protein [Phycisphaerales bacterium]